MAVVKTYPVSRSWHVVHRIAAPCSCGGPSERRTARPTAIGTSSRTSVSTMAEWCSGTSCIWARSTPRRLLPGERRSRFSTRTREAHGRWRCSRRIAARPLRATPRSCSFACRSCGCVGHGNGAPAGWPDSCGGTFSWIGSGDRGVPTEAVLAEMSKSDPPVQYLVGAPKGRLNRLEKHLLEKPWQDAREGVKVKLLAEDGELYVFAQSSDRVSKERAMRRRQLKWLWKRLRQIAAMDISRQELLMKLGAARAKAPTAWRLVDIEIDKQSTAFAFALNRKKL